MDSEHGQVKEISLKNLDDIPVIINNYIRKHMSSIINFASEGCSKDAVTLSDVARNFAHRGRTAKNHHTKLNTFQGGC